MKNMVSVPKGPQRRYDTPQARIGRSQFNMSRTHKTTFDASYLIPIFLEETLPGDTFVMKMEALVRMLQPLGSAVMDDIEMDTHFFWVPNRLTWDNWHYFLGEHNEAGAQDTTYTVPVISAGSSSPNVDGSAGSAALLFTYFGIPDGLNTTTGPDFQVLPLRSYNLIYNTYFRDQGLIDEVTVQTTNGPDSSALYGVWKSAKKHDYFTSALPYLQKGTAQTVTLADADSLDVLTATATSGYPSVYSTAQSAYRLMGYDATAVDIDPTADADGSEKLYVDASGASININTLRESLAIQRLLEKDARGGTRPNELIRAHFGVTVPDYRVDRPEYLGGGQGWINISPIANTSGVDSTNSVSGADEAQGQLYGTAAGTLRCSWAKSFVEHGHVIGILRARARLTYSQGLHRMWRRSTKYDFYWPELSHLGEQPILNSELYISNSSATDDATFGYQERFAEYRYGKSLVTGQFHPDAAASLDYWHLSEDFSSLPSLNQTFIEDQSPMDRIKAVTSGPDFIADMYFDLKAARPLPVRAIPSILGGRF